MEEEKWYLTEWGCLYLVLNDYGIDLNHITPKMGEHMVNDFMNNMVKAGYINEIKNEEDENNP